MSPLHTYVGLYVCVCSMERSIAPYNKKPFTQQQQPSNSGKRMTNEQTTKQKNRRLTHHNDMLLYMEILHHLLLSHIFLHVELNKSCFLQFIEFIIREHL